MPSVMTIAGAKPGKKKRRRRKARPLGSATGASCKIGETKRVRAGRGGKCTQELACTGTGLTGWEFTKGTRRCPR